MKQNSGKWADSRVVKKMYSKKKKKWKIMYSFATVLLAVIW